MTNWDYNRDIPFATNNASNDQPKMKINTNSTADLINVDHVGFQQNNGGYHTIIHEITQTNVTTVAGINQVFSGIPGTLVVNTITTPNIPSNGDTQLYTLTGQGGLSQLTGNSAGTNGYCWAGGILLQWGFRTIAVVHPGFQGSVTFPAPFPNNCFIVTGSCKYDSSVGFPSGICNVVIDQKTLSVTKFNFTINTGSSDTCTGFYWFAIGN